VAHAERCSGRRTSVPATGRACSIAAIMLIPIILGAWLGATPTVVLREAMTTTNPSPSTFAPYESKAANDIYNLLFCDLRESFRARHGERPTGWQRVLFTEPPDVPGLTKLAGDASQDGRIRYLAFARLRVAGAQVSPKILLGVIVEVALSDGLDALAAYSDGGVRYVNHSGKMVIVEGVNEFRPLVEKLFEVSRPVVARIGPWTQPRRPPPDKGSVRLTFLVSDGLYFGEGQTQVLERDALAGPVFREAAQLLTKVVATGSKKAK
jgi:hypothetical protein